jgi:hypothetical protein
MAAVIVGCGGGNGGITLSNFTTGMTHSTVWGSFAVPFPGGSPHCDINVAPPFTPAGWWAVNPTITPSSDTVGVTVWPDTLCARAQQTLYRAAMMVDLSPFYPMLKIPAGSTTPQGGRINTATLQFNVVVASGNTNPFGFACSSFVGAAGKVHVLTRDAVIQQDQSQLVVGSSRLIQASPAAGPFDLTHVLGAFPRAGDLIADLTLLGGPGNIAGGTISDTGPGIHAVTLDVTRWVVGAVNLNMQQIGFTVASIGEGATIAVPAPSGFACRSWVQPTGFTIKFL